LQRRPFINHTTEAASPAPSSLESEDLLARVARGRKAKWGEEAAEADAAGGGITYALPSRSRHLQNMESLSMGGRSRRMGRGRGGDRNVTEGSLKENATLI
jgi:hypothetical protein